MNLCRDCAQRKRLKKLQKLLKSAFFIDFQLYCEPYGGYRTAARAVALDLE